MLVFLSIKRRVSKVCVVSIYLNLFKLFLSVSSWEMQVLVSSCDTVKTQLFLEARTVAQGGVGQVNMPLIADADGQLAKKYGVYGETSLSQKKPLRAMFIIDPSGIVRSTSIDDEGRDWRPSQWVFDSLRKLQELSVSDPMDETFTKGAVNGFEKFTQSPNQCVYILCLLSTKFCCLLQILLQEKTNWPPL